MKRIILFLAIFLIIALSCPLYAAGIRDAPEESSSGSSVWRITKDDSILYLGGSIHILREIDFPLPVEFNYAFSLADILVLETDIGQMESPEILQYLLSQMFLPRNETLQTILEPDAYELLLAVCNDYGIPIISVYRLKPSMVINMLTYLQYEKLGFVQEGVDEYFFEKANDINMLIKYLEPVQTQIDMLLTMGEGYESDYVRYALYDMENNEAYIEQLVTEWRNGTSLFFDEMLIDMKDQWPVLYKSLITDRHDAWMPQIYKFLASGQIHFVVAGLAHMHGPDGLLQLLRDYGCTIEQLTR
jgi:hypothetical protein